MLLSNILEIDHFKDKDFSYTTQRKKCSSFNTFDLDNVQLYVNLKKKSIILRSSLTPRLIIDLTRLCIAKLCLKPLFFSLPKSIGKKSKECMNVVKTNIFFYRKFKNKRMKRNTQNRLKLQPFKLASMN